jgi:hypothetical protein
VLHDTLEETNDKNFDYLNSVADMSNDLEADIKQLEEQL